MRKPKTVAKLSDEAAEAGMASKWARQTSVMDKENMDIICNG